MNIYIKIYNIYIYIFLFINLFQLINENKYYINIYIINIIIYNIYFYVFLFIS